MAHGCFRQWLELLYPEYPPGGNFSAGWGRWRANRPCHTEALAEQLSGINSRLEMGEGELDRWEQIYVLHTKAQEQLSTAVAEEHGKQHGMLSSMEARFKAGQED